MTESKLRATHKETAMLTLSRDELNLLLRGINFAPGKDAALYTALRARLTFALESIPEAPR